MLMKGLRVSSTDKTPFKESSTERKFFQGIIYWYKTFRVKFETLGFQLCIPLIEAPSRSLQLLKHPPRHLPLIQDPASWILLIKDTKEGLQRVLLIKCPSIDLLLKKKLNKESTDFLLSKTFQVAFTEYETLQRVFYQYTVTRHKVFH